MSQMRAALCNLKVKDTLKRQKTLHTGRLMREFEEIRETLIHRTATLVHTAAARRAAPANKTGEKVLFLRSRQGLSVYQGSDSLALERIHKGMRIPEVKNKDGQIVLHA